MIKTITVLGASGSIGLQVLDTLKSRTDYKLVGISCYNNIEVLKKILGTFSTIKYCYIYDSKKVIDLKKTYKDINFFSGDDGLILMIKEANSDVYENSISGFAGLFPSIEILKLNKILLLANKESLVVGGEFIKELLNSGHGVVQSFPMAQDAGKKYGIKILYGCELYMIEDYLTGAINPLDMNLDKASYVVVDTESTGLSVKYDRIIEIGAVKIVNGFVTENFESLVNPEIEIPEKLQKITHISNEMVKDAPKFKDIITKFLEFAKGSILIAHNAQFDYWIINEEMINNGFGPLTLPWL